MHINVSLLSNLVLLGDFNVILYDPLFFLFALVCYLDNVPHSLLSLNEIEVDLLSIRSIITLSVGLS